MQKLAIYTRNEGGIVTYRGEQEWESLEQLFDATYAGCEAPGDHIPETESLAGWPHRRVTWYGGIGLGSD